MVSHTNDTCPDAIATASYVAGAMSEETKASFEAHLGGCDACLARLAELSGLGDEPPAGTEPVALDRAWRRVEQALHQWGGNFRHDADPATAGEAARRAPGRVIPLRPVVRAPARRRDPRALAAATDEPPPLSAITLMAEGVALMGKLGRSEETGDLLVYLMADDMATLAGARVVARDEETGGLSEGSPDDFGVAPLAATASWNPTKLRIDIHLPR